MKGRKEHKHHEGHETEHKAEGGEVHGMLHEHKHDGKDRHHEKLEVTKKRGGKVEGKKAHHRLDRRARGGRMTPSSPLSGASVKEPSYAHGDLKAGSEGMGREKGGHRD
jgi:hypothetical protein